ncbi:MAG: hypothetical protein GY906_16325, partial [bacterium]|nr:hypothetical protein [bacterium]
GVASFSRYNDNNVDLNRNFSGPEGCSEPPCFSEPETQAIRDLTEVMGKRFATSVSMHGGATCFNAVFNYTLNMTSDEPIFFSSWDGGPQDPFDPDHDALPAPHGLAQAYMDGNTTPGFWYTNGADWYPTWGDTNDWSYYYWRALDTTLEVTGQKTPPATQIPTYTAEHRQAVLNYLLKTFQGIHGAMTDSQSGTPLDGTITVTATGSAQIPVPHEYRAVFSDPIAGDFHRVLQPGTYSLRCDCPGYDPTEVTGIVVLPDTSTVVDCSMNTATSELIFSDDFESGNTSAWDSTTP